METSLSKRQPKKSLLFIKNQSESLYGKNTSQTNRVTNLLSIAPQSRRRVFLPLPVDSNRGRLMERERERKIEEKGGCENEEFDSILIKKFKCN